MASGFMYMWEYVVPAAHTPAFLEAYGPSGTWAQLFQRAPGYIRTELHRDCANPRRFVTIDYWESRAQCEAFRALVRDEFEALDAACAAWTTSEREIGTFEPTPAQASPD